MSRTIVIGDIHGCYEELVALLDHVGVTSDDRVVSVGDLVDRGPDPGRVLELFRDRPNTVALAGNHERKHVRGVFSYAQEITRLQLGGDYPRWVQWMSSLPYYLELDDAIVVHAAALPDVPLDEQKPEILCGSTAGERELERVLGEQDWVQVWRGPKPIVFGHRVVDQPLVKPGMLYGIDTGACHGGALTALSLPDFSLHSVQARQDHWSRVKRQWQGDVLASKPWRELEWVDLDEQLGRFTHVTEPAARDYLDALRAWRVQLEHRISETYAAIIAEGERLQHGTSDRELREHVKSHPLAGFMFQSLRGRLDEAAFRKQCRTPSKLEAFASAVGLPAIPLPVYTHR